MTFGTQVARILSTVCGLLMVAVAGIETHGPAFTAALLALAAVAGGTLSRPVATLAVLLTVAVLVLSDPTATQAATSGLAACGYLVLRHAASSGTGLDGLSGATMIGAVGFAFAGLVATAFPLQLAWLPLLAPLAVFAIYLLATRPFLRDENLPR